MILRSGIWERKAQGSGKIDKNAKRVRERRTCLHLGEGNPLQVVPLLLNLLNIGLKSFSSPRHLTALLASFHCRQNPETHTLLRTTRTQLAACFCQLHRPGTDSGTEEQEVRSPWTWEAHLILTRIEGLGPGSRVPGSLKRVNSNGGGLNIWAVSSLLAPSPSLFSSPWWACLERSQSQWWRWMQSALLPARVRAALRMGVGDGG